MHLPWTLNIPAPGVSPCRGPLERPPWPWPRWSLPWFAWPAFASGLGPCLIPLSQFRYIAALPKKGLCMCICFFPQFFFLSEKQLLYITVEVEDIQHDGLISICREVITTVHVLTSIFCFYLWQNMHNIKFTSLTTSKCTVQWHKIHRCITITAMYL